MHAALTLVDLAGVPFEGGLDFKSVGRVEERAGWEEERKETKKQTKRLVNG